jgi:hypothetical protein
MDASSKKIGAIALNSDSTQGDYMSNEESNDGAGKTLAGAQGNNVIATGNAAVPQHLLGAALAVPGLGVVVGGLVGAALSQSKSTSNEDDAATESVINDSAAVALKGVPAETHEANANHVVAPMLANALELTQINKFHTKAGHGFAAEDANILADRLAGKVVEEVGKSNTLDGADRISNNIKIQTKYCQNPTATVGAAFKDDVYRYAGQKLEVPSDQYDECVRLMREKIAGGQVPGFSNPNDAEKIVQKGDVTYSQAVNIAKAGTIDGLVYDGKMHAVSAGFTVGLSFAVQFAQLRWNGYSTADAMREASMSALGSGALTLSTGIITSQVLRSRAAAVGVVLSRDGVKAVASTGLGKAAIERVAQASLGRAVYGAAAVNHVAKLARSNVVTASVATVVMSAPDFYRAAISNNVSWAQFGKNMAINGAGVAAGAGGWVAGSAAGAAIGSAFGGVGAVPGALIGGIVGSISAGAAGGMGSKALLDQFVKDDAKEMVEILPDLLMPVLGDYMLNATEVEQFTAHLKVTIDAPFLRDMYGSSDRSRFVRDAFAPKCQQLIAARPKVIVPDEIPMEEVVTAFLDAVDQVEHDIQAGGRVGPWAALAAPGTRLFYSDAANRPALAVDTAVIEQVPVEPIAPVEVTATEQPVDQSVDQIAVRLTTLASLRDRGLITAKEYADRRTSIVDAL